MPVQDATQQVHTGRLLLLCLVLPFLGKTQLGEQHLGRIKRKALVGLGMVGKQEQSWSLHWPSGRGKVHVWNVLLGISVIKGLLLFVSGSHFFLSF